MTRRSQQPSPKPSHRRHVLGGCLLLTLTVIVTTGVHAESEPVDRLDSITADERIEQPPITPSLPDDWQHLIDRAWQQAQSYQASSEQHSREARKALTATMADESSLSERPTPQVMVFVSLGMPDASLRQWLAQANDLQVPLILRGLYQDRLLTTAKRIQQLLGDDHPLSADADEQVFIPGGMAIHPQWFSQLNIQQVPTVVVIRPGHCLPTRASQPSSCTDHDVDRVQGNVSLYDALALLAAHGDVPDIAQQVLARRKSAISNSATSMGSQP